MMDFKQKRDIFMQEFENQKEVLNECNNNIEKYRKGNARLVFQTSDGVPIANQRIVITQKTHDFKYGANIFLLDEFQEDWENEAYKEFFKKHFNLATVPFYWDAIEPEEGQTRYEIGSKPIYRRPAPDLCVKFSKENNILPKLHCLFYEYWTPDWLPKDNEKEMRRLYEKRFQEIAKRYCGSMYEFEVTNEMILSSEDYWLGHKSVLCDTRDVVEWAFALAKKYFKDEKLVINEGGPLPFISEDAYLSKYFLQLEKLLALGTPIDKIGVQNHIFTGINTGGEADEEEVRKDAKLFANPQKYLKALNLLSEFGLPLEVTEVTIPTFGDSEEAEELQADLLENLYTIWFSVPAVETIVYWNTVDFTAHEKENALRGGLLRRDFTPKKSAERLYDLFHRRWHTDLEVFTDENGVVEFRGFYGDYEVAIAESTYDFSLKKDLDNQMELTVTSV